MKKPKPRITQPVISNRPLDAKDLARVIGGTGKNLTHTNGPNAAKNLTHTASGG